MGKNGKRSGCQEWDGTGCCLHESAETRWKVRFEQRHRGSEGINQASVCVSLRDKHSQQREYQHKGFPFMGRQGVRTVWKKAPGEPGRRKPESNWEAQMMQSLPWGPLVGFSLL